MANETHRISIQRKSGVELGFVGNLNECEIVFERNAKYDDTTHMYIYERSDNGDEIIVKAWERK